MEHSLHACHQVLNRVLWLFSSMCQVWFYLSHVNSLFFLAEKKCSVLENSDKMTGNGQLQGAVMLSLNTPLRLTRSNVLR